MWQTAYVPFHDLFIDFISSDRINNMKAQHYHDTYEVYLQLSGERNLFYDDICYTLKKGDLVIIKPFEIHYTQHGTSNSYSRYVLNFHPQKLDTILSKSEASLLLQKLPFGVMSLHENDMEQVHQLLQSIDQISKKTGVFSEKRIYANVFILLTNLIDLSQTLCDVSHHDTQTKLHRSTQSIQQEIVEAIQYINTHYKDNITLEHMKEVTHLSKYHFCRVFHQYTGATFHNYLTNVRLTKVHPLLIHSNLTLEQIASKTGFRSSPQLNRAFQTVYQMSPSEFRKRKKHLV